MQWPQLGQWEWAIGEAVVLPLLFVELWRVRRSQRRDREAAGDSAATEEADGTRHAEGQHRQYPGGAKPIE
jgi:hypothetical protein